MESIELRELIAVCLDDEKFHVNDEALHSEALVLGTSGVLPETESIELSDLSVISNEQLASPVWKENTPGTEYIELSDLSAISNEQLAGTIWKENTTSVCLVKDVSVQVNESKLSYKMTDHEIARLLLHMPVMSRGVKDTNLENYRLMRTQCRGVPKGDAIAEIAEEVKEFIDDWKYFI
ncbi:hypothetical protein SK128_018230, partial [Halocaridina rubra]